MPGYANPAASVGTIVHTLEKNHWRSFFSTWAEDGWTGGDNANAHLIFYTVGIMVDSLRFYLESRSY